MALGLGVLLVPVLDHAVKHAVRERLGTAAVSLGPAGELRAVHGRMWVLRGAPRVPLGVVWLLWIAAGSILVTTSLWAPSLGWCSGLVLGGSLSHLLETSRRGAVLDYVCLRFWPAFDLADVALAAGALGMVVQICT